METNSSSDVGELVIGPWGGSGGKDFDYRAKMAITQIIVYIDFPSEYLTGISGFYAKESPEGKCIVLKSLRFYTNRTEYDPFGLDAGDAFSFRPKGAIITGFHGRAGWYIDALGVYFRPLSLVVLSINPVEEESTGIQESGNKCVGEISIGPFGGSGGNKFEYSPINGLKKIVVFYNGDVINWIMFEGGNGKSSKKFGGGFKDCTRSAYVDIDSPSDFLTGISGTYGSHGGFVVVKSLKFYTKLNVYGPYGSDSGTRFSIQQKGCCVTGFHGRGDGYIDSVGVFLKPLCSFSVPVALTEHSRNELMMNKSMLLRNPGPWGGEDGRMFDDGVFGDIKEVHVHMCSNGDVISGVQFKYLKRNGDDFWSPVHGSRGGDVVKKVDIDCGGNEFILGVEGFYAPIEANCSKINVIRSLTFHTNKGKYGPMGCEIGKYFTSVVCENKVVGFFGKSSAYLNAIGVHTEYY